MAIPPRRSPGLEPLLEVLGRANPDLHHVERPRAGRQVQRDDAAQHHETARQRVDEELDRPRMRDSPTSPDADEEVHRDQHDLPEQVEEDEVERDEHADHQRFKQEKRDHVLLHALRDGGPTREDRDRQKERREDHEGQGKPVNAHIIGDLVAEPGVMLDELKAAVRRIELNEKHQRNREGDQGCPKRDPARVPVRGFVIAPQDGQEKRAYDRQKDDRGEDGPIFHILNKAPRKR